MEVSVVGEERKVCADFSHEERNCPYAKVVEEKGEYLAIIFQAKEKDGIPDLDTMYNVKERVDTTCLCVYCTHPYYSKEKIVGSVEPYFACHAPKDCPTLQKKCETAMSKKWTLLQKIFCFVKK